MRVVYAFTAPAGGTKGKARMDEQNFIDSKLGELPFFSYKCAVALGWTKAGRGVFPFYSPAFKLKRDTRPQRSWHHTVAGDEGNTCFFLKHPIV